MEGFARIFLSTEIDLRRSTFLKHLSSAGMDSERNLARVWGWLCDCREPIGPSCRWSLGSTFLTESESCRTSFSRCFLDTMGLKLCDQFKVVITQTVLVVIFKCRTKEKCFFSECIGIYLQDFHKTVCPSPICSKDSIDYLQNTS